MLINFPIGDMLRNLFKHKQNKVVAIDTKLESKKIGGVIVNGQVIIKVDKNKEINNNGK